MKSDESANAKLDVEDVTQHHDHLQNRSDHADIENNKITPV